MTQHTERRDEGFDLLGNIPTEDDSASTEEATSGRSIHVHPDSEDVTKVYLNHEDQVAFRRRVDTLLSQEHPDLAKIKALHQELVQYQRNPEIRTLLAELRAKHEIEIQRQQHEQTREQQFRSEYRAVELEIRSLQQIRELATGGFVSADYASQQLSAIEVQLETLEELTESIKDLPPDAVNDFHIEKLQAELEKLKQILKLTTDEQPPDDYELLAIRSLRETRQGPKTFDELTLEERVQTLSTLFDEDDYSFNPPSVKGILEKSPRSGSGIDLSPAIAPYLELMRQISSCQKECIRLINSYNAGELQSVDYSIAASSNAVRGYLVKLKQQAEKIIDSFKDTVLDALETEKTKLEDKLRGAQADLEKTSKLPLLRKLIGPDKDTLEVIDGITKNISALQAELVNINTTIVRVQDALGKFTEAQKEIIAEAGKIALSLDDSKTILLLNSPDNTPNLDPRIVGEPEDEAQLVLETAARQDLFQTCAEILRGLDGNFDDVAWEDTHFSEWLKYLEDQIQNLPELIKALKGSLPESESDDKKDNDPQVIFARSLLDRLKTEIPSWREVKAQTDILTLGVVTELKTELELWEALESLPEDEEITDIRPTLVTLAEYMDRLEPAQGVYYPMVISRAQELRAYLLGRGLAGTVADDRIDTAVDFLIGQPKKPAYTVAQLETIQAAVQDALGQLDEGLKADTGSQALQGIRQAARAQVQFVFDELSNAIATESIEMPDEDTGDSDVADHSSKANKSSVPAETVELPGDIQTHLDAVWGKVFNQPYLPDRASTPKRTFGKGLDVAVDALVALVKASYESLASNLQFIQKLEALIAGLKTSKGRFKKSANTAGPKLEAMVKQLSSNGQA